MNSVNDWSNANSKKCANICAKKQKKLYLRNIFLCFLQDFFSQKLITMSEWLLTAILRAQPWNQVDFGSVIFPAKLRITEQHYFASCMYPRLVSHFHYWELTINKLTWVIFMLTGGLKIRNDETTKWQFSIIVRVNPSDSRISHLTLTHCAISSFRHANISACWLAKSTSINPKQCSCKNKIVNSSNWGQKV